MNGHHEKSEQRTRQELIRYVHLLRFGPKCGRTGGRMFTKIDDIAMLVKISHSQVRVMLRRDQESEDRRTRIRKGPRPKLTPEQVAYLTSPLILQKWACKTLAERAVLFHRRFGEVKMAPQTLFRLYKAHGIKRKCLKYVKTLRYEKPDVREASI